MNDVKSTNEKDIKPKETFNVDKNIVTLKCNRYGGHDIKYGRNVKTIFYGGLLELNISNPQDMRLLIIYLKQMNVNINRKSNWYSEKHGDFVKSIPLWEIVKGEETIPKNLRKIKHRPNKLILDLEMKEILNICPNYSEFIARKEKTKLEIVKRLLK